MFLLRVLEFKFKRNSENKKFPAGAFVPEKRTGGHPAKAFVPERLHGGEPDKAFQVEKCVGGVFL
jgi:hypothetical protein